MALVVLPIQETKVRSLGQNDSPGGGNSYPLQDSCLGNPMHRGAWPTYSPWGCKSFTVRGVVKEWDMT